MTGTLSAGTHIRRCTSREINLHTLQSSSASSSQVTFTHPRDSRRGTMKRSGSGGGLNLVTLLVVACDCCTSTCTQARQRVDAIAKWRNGSHDIYSYCFHTNAATSLASPTARPTWLLNDERVSLHTARSFSPPPSSPPQAPRHHSITLFHALKPRTRRRRPHSQSHCTFVRSLHSSASSLSPS